MSLRACLQSRYSQDLFHGSRPGLKEGIWTPKILTVHAGQRCHNSTSAQEKLTADQDIRYEGEEDKDPMGEDSIAGVDDFQVGMAFWSVLLDFTGQDGEHEDLDRRTSGILVHISAFLNELQDISYIPRMDLRRHMCMPRCSIGVAWQPRSRLILCRLQSGLASHFCLQY